MKYNKVAAVALWAVCLGWVGAASAGPIDIRTAAQDSHPKFTKAGAEISGLCIDIFKAVERVDPSLRFPKLSGFMPLPRVEAMMEEGSMDVACGLAATKERRTRFDVIETPLYKTSLILAARAGEASDPKSFDEIKALGADATVLVVTGTAQAELAGAQSGLRVDSAARDPSANMMKLVNGRGRFVLHNDFALAEEIKRGGLGGKVVLLSGNFATEGRYFIVSKKASPELRLKLAASVEKLSKSGELAKIFEAYRPK